MERTTGQDGEAPLAFLSRKMKLMWQNKKFRKDLQYRPFSFGEGKEGEVGHSNIHVTKVPAAKMLPFAGGKLAYPGRNRITI